MDSSTSGEMMYFFQSTGEQFWENVQGLLTFIKDNFGHFLWRLLGIVLILILAQLVLIPLILTALEKAGFMD